MEQNNWKARETSRTNKTELRTFTSLPHNSDLIALLWFLLASSMLAAFCLLACLLLMRNNLPKNYVPMQLFEAAVWVLIFIQIKSILFQKIYITDVCIIIKSPMALGELFLTFIFFLNETIFYLDLFGKELKNYVTNVFWENIYISFFFFF